MKELNEKISEKNIWNEERMIQMETLQEILKYFGDK